MLLDVQRILAGAGFLFVLSTVHCQAIDLPVSTQPNLSTVQGWTEQDRTQWYHQSAGTQLIPYDWFVALEDEPLKNSFTRTGILADPANQDRLPIGFSKTEGPSVSEPQVGLTCAFCHTTQFTYQGNQIRIEGGPSLQYNARFLATLLENLGDTVALDRSSGQLSERFKAFAARVFQRRGQELTPDSVGKLAREVAGLTQELVSRGTKDASSGLWGPGRFDALGRGANTVFAPLNPDNLRPANAPVSIPPLWGVWEYDWVQWGGSIQHPLARNIAQVIDVNANIFTSPAPPFGPLIDPADPFRSSVDIPKLKTLEELAHRLQPPRWPKAFPAIDLKLAAKGKDLYHGNREKGIPNLCAHCHVAHPLPNRHPNGPSLQVSMIPQNEVGTDPLYLKNFSQRTVDRGALGLERVSAGQASEWLTTEIMKRANASDDPDYRHLTNKWRDDLQYIARPHLAVWATAPFLHNGSVPNLYALLSPAKDRPACFYLRPNMEFDPVKVGFVLLECSGSPTFRDPLAGFEFKTQLPGNSNKGHEFQGSDCSVTAKTAGTLGCELPVADRWAIIEYLKTCDLDRLVIRNALFVMTLNRDDDTRPAVLTMRGEPFASEIRS